MKLLIFLSAVSALSCGLGDLGIEEAAPDSIPETPSWSHDVLPIVGYYCAHCHSGGGGGRRGCGGGGLDFSTYDGTVRCLNDLQQTVNAGTMPPGAAPQLSLRDLAVLERWKQQGFLQ
jgi:hypothetical protein